MVRNSGCRFQSSDPLERIGASRVAIGLTSLPDHELVMLLPLLYEKAREGSNGKLMFSNKFRVSCPEILVKLKLREGLEVYAMLLNDTSWGKQNRMPQAARMLKSYGGHPKEFLGPLRETVKGLTGSGDAKWRDLINETIRSIEQAPAPKGHLARLCRRKRQKAKLRFALC